MKPSTKKVLKKMLIGHLFASPVIIGILVFTYYPAVRAVWYSFFSYDGFEKMNWVGFQNYKMLFTLDPYSGIVFKNTILYAVINVPLSLLLGYGVALLVNTKFKGIGILRTLVYLPVVIPGVAMGILWRDLLEPTNGIYNQILSAFGLPPGMFFESANSALPTLIFTTTFSVGGSMVIWLAAFKNIPLSFYEAAKVDGANWLTRTLRLTIPLSTPMIFYNLVLSVIGSLQVFTTFIIAAGGDGPDKSLLFIAVKIYKEAFENLRFGYASAWGLMLALIVAVLTFVMFKTGKWIHYAEADE